MDSKALRSPTSLQDHQYVFGLLGKPNCYSTVGILLENLPYIGLGIEGFDNSFEIDFGITTSFSLATPCGQLLRSKDRQNQRTRLKIKRVYSV